MKRRVVSNPKFLNSEDLLNAHYTHPSRMKSPTLRKHDNLQKQMSAYNELLQRTRVEYSTNVQPRITQMLESLTMLVTKEDASVSAITDLNTLRQALRKLEHIHQFSDGKGNDGKQTNTVGMKDQGTRSGNRSEKVGEIVSENEKTVLDERKGLLDFFAKFEEELEHINLLREYFNNRIYACLRKYFGISDKNRGGSSSTWDHKIKPDHNSNGFTSASSSSSSSYSDTWFGGRNFLTGSNTNSFAVNNGDIFARDAQLTFLECGVDEQLLIATEKWKDLLKTGQYDSKTNNAGRAGNLIDNFSGIVRLIPILISMGYSCLELARVWWIQAIHPHLENNMTSIPTFADNRPMEKTREERLDLQNNDKDLAASIQETTDLLSSKHKELIRTSERLDRCDMLEQRFNEAEKVKFSANDAYLKLVNKRLAIQADLEKTRIKGGDISGKTGELKEYEKKILFASQDLTLASYRFFLVEEDYKFNQQLRPAIMESIETIQKEIAELNGFLKSKEKGKNELGPDVQKSTINGDMNSRENIRKSTKVRGNNGGRTSTSEQISRNRSRERNSRFGISQDSSDSKGYAASGSDNSEWL